MKPIFNEAPKLSYFVDSGAHASQLSEGYASTIGYKGSATVLAFQDVEDHVDGCGWAALWLVQGSGTFCGPDGRVDVTKGDVLVFDDCQEHGFESDDICVGVNFPIEERYDQGDLRRMIQDFNTPASELLSLKSTKASFATI